MYHDKQQKGRLPDTPQEGDVLVRRGSKVRFLFLRSFNVYENVGLELTNQGKNPIYWYIMDILRQVS